MSVFYYNHISKIEGIHYLKQLIAQVHKSEHNLKKIGNVWIIYLKIFQWVNNVVKILQIYLVLYFV